LPPTAKNHELERCTELLTGLGVNVSLDEVLDESLGVLGSL
jgi:hypothetical protein